MCQDSSMQQVWVWLWVLITMAFNRSTWWFEENTCSARAKDPRSPFFRAQRCSRRRWSKDLPVGQCRCGGIQHMGCCTLPHMTTSCPTALLYFYMRACKCQLFTDEGSRKLPKRLNYLFSVLASATNRSILKFRCYIVQCHFSRLECGQFANAIFQ